MTDNLASQTADNTSKRSLRFWMITAVSAGWLLFQLYAALFVPFHPMLMGPVHLLFGLTVAFLYHPAGRKTDKKWMQWLDMPLFISLVFLFYFFITQTERLQGRAPYISPVLTMDKIAMLLTLVLLLEAVRRVLGNVLLIFICVFLGYGWFGTALPAAVRCTGTNLKQFTDLMIMGQEGIFSSPLITSASYIFYFIIFGALFSTCGGGKMLIDFGLKLADKTAGGPAKAAVISSGLMGMVNGSSVANVSTTGVMTIPMMKKVGYLPEQAGAIEAVASTGGQLMPPIMGVAAFIMADMLGVPYARIAFAAFIPAVAYFFSVFCLVGNLARKSNTKVDSSVKFDVDPILPRLYLLIPAFVLVYFIVSGASLMRAGLYGMFTIIICNFFSRYILQGKYYENLNAVGKSLLDGAKQASEIAIPTAACGIIIGIVIQSGLATKFASIISTLGTGNILPALLVAMIGVMLLGMALPTVAAYLVAYVLFIPVMSKLNIDPLSANMFIFYYGILAQVTPPVCLASFTAAGIAGADSWKTGWTGFRYCLVAFLVPYIFVYDPGILLIGTTWEIVKGTIILLFGTYLLAGSLAGFLIVNLKKIEQALLLASSVALIVPEGITDIIGAVVGTTILIILFLRRSKAKKAGITSVV
ncbi:MAG: TRAP transporter fused permease subunit [Dehalobacterium sp.]